MSCLMKKKKQRRNWCTAWGWTALKTLFTVMNRHPIFSHRSRWGRICAFGRGGWIFTWEIQSAIKNSSPMKKPLPLTMVPPTRTAGLKKYGKISARRWRKSRSTSYGMWRTVLWKKHGHGSFITLRKTFFGKRRLFTMPFPKKCLKRWKSFSKIFSGRGCAAFCLLK